MKEFKVGDQVKVIVKCADEDCNICDEYFGCVGKILSLEKFGNTATIRFEDGKIQTFYFYQIKLSKTNQTKLK